LKNKYFTEESPIGQGRDSLIKRGSRINNNVANSDSSEEEEEDADECTLSQSNQISSFQDNYKDIDDDIEGISRIENVKKMEKIQTTSIDGFVGFSSLPRQVYRKALRNGFEFVMLVVGETGLGKSTLINSMFLTDIYNNKASAKMEKTVEVGTHQVLLEEGGVKLSLTVVDTPGYGDAVDNTDCWEPVVEYVEKQFDKFLEAETRVKRESLPDSRVHACLYFIAPSGHGLKRIDVEFMKRIHDKVNIIPVIGKADACTKEELVAFKQKIREQLEEFEISVYEFPRDDDEAESSDVSAPFALVGSNTVMEDMEGKKFRGRKYPWGCVNIEDQAHSDFSLLRNLLLCEHTQHMIDLTSSTHYENYRCDKLKRLISGGNDDDLSDKNLLTYFEKESEEHSCKVDNMNKQMGAIFDNKIEEKNQMFDTFEEDQNEDIEKERRKLNLEKENILLRRNEFEKEKTEWDARCLSSTYRSSKSMESLRKKNKFKFSLGSMNFGNQ